MLVIGIFMMIIGCVGIWIKDKSMRAFFSVLVVSIGAVMFTASILQ